MLGRCSYSYTQPKVIGHYSLFFMKLLHLKHIIIQIKQVNNIMDPLWIQQVGSGEPILFAYFDQGIYLSVFAKYLCLKVVFVIDRIYIL